MADILAQPLVALLVVLGVLVLVHEAGHFLMARATGIAVETFSIGFGPKLFSFTRKGTEYQVAALPLGGYVKFVGAFPGDEVPERFRGQELFRASVTARILTAFAGPFANLLLAALVYAALGFNGVKHIPAEVGYVLPGSAAELGGLRAGDHVLSINGKPVHTWDEMRGFIIESPNAQMNFHVQRYALGTKAAKEFDLTLTPRAEQGEDEIGLEQKQGRLGINPSYVQAILSQVPLAQDDPNASARIPIGSYLVRVSYNGQGPGERELKIDDAEQKALNWANVLDLLEAAYHDQASYLSFYYRAPNSEQEQKVELTTKAWQHLMLGTTPKTDRLSLLDQERLAETLGVVHSQLTVAAGEDAAKALLQVNDRIVRFAGHDLKDIHDLVSFLQKNEQPTVELGLLRGGSLLTVNLALTPKDVQRMEGKKVYYSLPVRFLGEDRLPAAYIERYDSPLAALGYGMRSTYHFSQTLVRAIVGLFTGDLPLKALGGPMIIAKVAGEAAELGIEAFVRSLALISINLGLINLVPLPALDGGQMVLLTVEALRRRPLSQAAIENYQRLGFAILMALIVISTYNDLSRFWASMLRSIF